MEVSIGSLKKAAWTAEDAEVNFCHCNATKVSKYGVFLVIIWHFWLSAGFYILIYCFPYTGFYILIQITADIV